MDAAFEGDSFALRILMGCSYDGQAGASVIVLKRNSPSDREAFMNGLHNALRTKGLPAYACPRLIRIAER